MKKIVVLGSTGSIGRQALEVIAADSELEVVGLSAKSSWQLLFEQAEKFKVRQLALLDSAADQAQLPDSAELFEGPDCLVNLIVAAEPDLVLNAVVGFTGLFPTVVALSDGIDLALANKESLVVAGELISQLAEVKDAAIIPVDSEHSALLQLISDQPAGCVDQITLTASGGPFHGYSSAQLEEVTVDQTLNHPTWQMGGKITVDSATLMNKGLELIEAHHFFGTPYDRIDVVVHPQSIVHALVGLNDGSTLAHLGYPDMKVPISYALNYPERHDTGVEPLDLAKVGSLTFEQPDTAVFSCLQLARNAGKAGGTAPCTLNAANEVAVEAFLAGAIPFNGIAAVVERTLERSPLEEIVSFEQLVGANSSARQLAQACVEEIGAVA